MSRLPSPFLESVRNVIRVRHYSIRTEKTYIDWIKRYIWFNNNAHPKDLGNSDVTRFLTHLAVNRDVSPSTQNQALNALNFLYAKVLEKPLGELNAVRAKTKQRIPVVLTSEEVKLVLSNLNGHHWLAACLMYGSGLRLMEVMRLRVINLDFDHRTIHVFNGKGGKDRIVTLPGNLIIILQRHLENVKNIHDKDLFDHFLDWVSCYTNFVVTPFLLIYTFRYTHWKYVLLTNTDLNMTPVTRNMFFCYKISY